MSDIVERLRWGFLKKEDGSHYPVNPDGPEAADEIERLRDALRKIADGKRDADQSYATLFAEVVREARAALPKG